MLGYEYISLNHEPQKDRMIVYCGKCKFYKESPLNLCVYKDNYKDTYIKKKECMIRSPSEINKNNDCGWYKPRNLWDVFKYILRNMPDASEE